MIAEIELGVLAELKAASDDGLVPFKWSTLETYPADWDEWLKAQKILRAPGAWVVFGGWRPASPDPDDDRVIATFGLVVMAENTRDEQSRRHGDPVDAKKPGTYVLAEWAARVLNGSNLGLDIGAISIGALRYVQKPQAFREKKVSMLSLELSTMFTLPDMIDADDLSDFTAAHINWDIPTLGGVGPDLPDDTHADATDDIEMER